MGVIKLYVATVEVLMKKERQGEPSFSQKLMVFWVHQTGMLQIVFFMSVESSQLGGVHGCSMMFGLAVQKFLNIEWFLHWELN